MRKIILIICLLMLSNVAWAQKAPDGFCGIKWGISKQELKKILKPTPHLHLDEYENWISFSPNSGDKGWEKIGEFKVTNYVFRFSKLRTFYEASVNFPKYLTEYPNNFDTLLEALTSKYGSPQRTTPVVLKINPNARVGTQYEWIIENKVEITLWYNDMEQRGINGTLVYTYLPIMRENEKARDKDVTKTKDKL